LHVTFSNDSQVSCTHLLIHTVAHH